MPHDKVTGTIEYVDQKLSRTILWKITLKELTLKQKNLQEDILLLTQIQLREEFYND